MDTKVFSVLEFDKILNIAKEYAVSDIGREFLSELSPATDFQTVEESLEETAAAETILKSSGRSPVDEFPDVRSILKNIQAVYTLSIPELLMCARCMKVSREAREILMHHSFPVLEKYTIQLIHHIGIENEISRCIISEDEISDNASAQLASIRRDKKITEDRVKEKITQYIKGPSQKFLQEPLYTIRNGRYVLPVKSENKAQFPGLVHDQSGTGQTLYIEPLVVVELGNKLKQLQLDEQREIERILSGLTALVSSCSDFLYMSLVCLGKLDALFSKAFFGIEYYAVKPMVNNLGHINLINARHPLLKQNSVVPISIRIGNEFQTLIITGPNTGGKTVSLKTVGLFCLMSQCGFFLPASEGTEISVFDNIYADIGDEQSIEQSLSTFSSHMKNIVSITHQAGPRSLVLLDELGAGTDPLEGAALAQALLESIKESGAITFATTHYSEVKAFALTTLGMENASMEFDLEHLCPTYKLYIGIPGKSNAFEISKRLGLDDEIITRAADFLSSNAVSFEDVLSSAQKSRETAEADRIEAEKHLQAIKKTEAELLEKQNRLDKEVKSIKLKAREEAKSIINDAKELADSVISDLRKTKLLDGKTVEMSASSARNKLKSFAESLQEPSSIGQNDVSNNISVVVGNSYFAPMLQRNVSVLQGPDSKGYVLVQSGISKTKLRVSDLQPVSINIKESSAKREVHQLNTAAIKMDLDLRGSTVDDAIMEIDRYIDLCRMHNLHEFNIIHGKGTGALRAGIHVYLKSNKSISSFRLGMYGEGDAGVTVVTLR